MLPRKKTKTKKTYTNVEKKPPVAILSKATIQRSHAKFRRHILRRYTPDLHV